LTCPERKTITSTEQPRCFLSRTHPEQALAVEYRHKVCGSALEDLKHAVHRRDARGRSSMADQRAQIDRFGSHRRTKIERNKRSFFVGLCSHVHEYLPNRF